MDTESILRSEVLAMFIAFGVSKLIFTLAIAAPSDYARATIWFEFFVHWDFLRLIDIRVYHWDKSSNRFGFRICIWIWDRLIMKRRGHKKPMRFGSELHHEYSRG